MHGHMDVCFHYLGALLPRCVDKCKNHLEVAAQAAVFSNALAGEARKLVLACVVCRTLLNTKT